VKKFSWNVYIAMVVSMLFWGFSYIWSKIVFTVFPPISTILLRLLISSLFLIVMGLALKRLQKLRKEDLPHILLLAFFQPFLYFLGENLGLYHVSSTVASVMIATIPLFTPIAAYWFFKERLAPMNISGIALSVFGVVMVIVKPDLSISVSILGILYLALAVASAVAYSVVVVKLSHRYTAFSLITYQNIIGTLYFIPLVLALEPRAILDAQITFKAIAALLQLAILASSLAYMLFIYGIQKIGMSRASAFANSIPVFTAMFAFFVLGEKLFIINMVGIALVIGGLLLAQVRFRRYRQQTVESTPDA
jgi:drug/metabolite transporter (DMT)-like permease